MSRLYGIVSAGNSQNYTEVAISSFFKNTMLSKDDTVVLVDNDGKMTKGNLPLDFLSRNVPYSFSAN